MSIILAIETSSELASCALLRGDVVFARESCGVRTHSQSILPMVQSVLVEAGLRLRDCDALAFGAGPGSFTGVRTACGIAQGLAFGADLPVLPICTLEAMAEACRERTGAQDVLAVLDARMGELYWAQYHFADGWRVLSAPALCAPDLLVPMAALGCSLQACGNGLAAHLAQCNAQAFADGALAGALADVMPHARHIALLAARAFAAGAGLSAHAAQPFYLRNKIAFTSAERRDIQVAKATRTELA